MPLMEADGKVMPPFDRDFLKQGQAIWEKRAGRPLALMEIDEAARNLVGYFDLLARWFAEEGKLTLTETDQHDQQ